MAKNKKALGSFDVMQSLFNFKDMYVTATYNSKNEKTGDCVQVSFIPVDMFMDNKIDYEKSETVCPSTCIFYQLKSCYVNLAYSVGAIVKAVRNNRYTQGLDYTKMRGRIIRIGAYGDCSSLPYEYVEKITKIASGFMNYTHGYKNCDQRFKNIAMASCETIDDALDAQSKGWRTFRVIMPNEPLLENETLCPNSKNANITCNMCLKCNGANGKSKQNIVVVRHGLSHKLKSFDTYFGTSIID